MADFVLICNSQTPNWASPEYAYHNVADQKSDVYSFGAFFSLVMCCKITPALSRSGVVLYEPD